MRRQQPSMGIRAAVARQRSGRPDARAGFAELCRGQSSHAAAAGAAAAQLDSSPAVPR
jgi:hypothetical protein